MSRGQSLQSMVNSLVDGPLTQGIFGLEACQSLSNSGLELRTSREPIAQLPNELLLKIVHLSLSVLNTYYYTRLWELSQVSTLWYDLVKHSPILWGYTHSGFTTTQVELALKRSKNALIDVVYNTFVSHDVRPYSEIVLKERSRWRYVKYKTDSADLLRYLNHRGFERIEEVDLVYYPIKWGPLLLDNLFGQHTPRLRHLKLSNILVN
ncbi:hypothetical protein FRB94_000381 [Tulasnella sp. JGI-2019a]|nr:hypothetical protein FRB94_000381 [Tulasnella sp. JGI-2019a]KAG8997393.1 hypothetical protein FRB93_000398 [Tulasnella sp. JGI-2019a]